MLKPIEMDENVTLAAQLEEEGGGPVTQHNSKDIGYNRWACMFA